ncbi:hypothetical protein CLCR_05204 [Cladophialophora carrionii]|uniref:Alpha/beta hydrolase fold-3 domain-containing protein n=1 Tax=Cladophialophora carrionii TaxID=86049 RepID=A0A1C1CLJ5_9EURO|nr:hypothetical protein CLCR_05204 [Cladophialophora carrionii]
MEVNGGDGGSRPLTSDFVSEPRRVLIPEKHHQARVTLLNDRLIQLGQEDYKVVDVSVELPSIVGVGLQDRHLSLPSVCLDEAAAAAAAAEDMTVTAGHGPAIKCRVFRPPSQEPQEPQEPPGGGVFYHIHGGGYVLGSASG